MDVGRPRRNTRLEWAGDSGWEVAHLLTGGHADFASGEELTEPEWRRIRKERDDALRRKRPAGFAPWPKEVS